MTNQTVNSIILHGYGEGTLIITQGFGQEQVIVTFPFHCVYCKKGISGGHLVRQWSSGLYCSACFNKLTQDGRITPQP